MALFQKKFYDKNWNFDNTALIALLKKAQKEQLKSEFWVARKWSKEILLFSKAGQKIDDMY